MKKRKIYELKNILTNGINEISDNKEGKKVLNALKNILIAKKKILKWRRKRKNILENVTFNIKEKGILIFEYDKHIEKTPFSKRYILVFIKNGIVN